MPLIPVLRGQRQAYLPIFKFKASLVYRASSRTARATQRNPVLKQQQKHNKIIIIPKAKNKDKKIREREI